MFYQTFGLDQFTTALMHHESTKHYSREAMAAIYEYYDDEFLQLDPVFLATEWEEYTSLADVIEGYGYQEDKYWDTIEPKLIDFLEAEVTTVLHLDNGGYLIKAF